MLIYDYSRAIVASVFSFLTSFDVPEYILVLFLHDLPAAQAGPAYLLIREVSSVDGSMRVLQARSAVWPLSYGRAA